MAGQSREELTMDVEYKNNSSKTKTIVFGVVAVLMTIATIVLAILYGINVGGSSVQDTTTIPGKTTTSPSDTRDDTCQSAACVSAASRILNAMNRDVDPCDDFFTYACGVWNRDHIIPDDKSSVSTFNGLRDDVSKVLKRVLERDSTSDRDSVVKAKAFYTSCMDTTTIDNLGVDPVKDLISEMGGWPVIGDSFNASAFNFEEVLAKFRSVFSTYGIVSSWVGADDKNSTENILQMDQPSLGMPNRDYYLDEATRNKTEPGYKQFMVDFITMVAGNKTNETVINDVVNEIIQFETDLAKIMAPDSARRDSLAIYNKMSLSDLLSTTNNNLDWLAYVNKVLEVRDDTLVADGDQEVVVYNPSYLGNVSKVVSDRWELVQNYLVWRVLKDRTSFMSAELRATRQPYDKATSGVSSEEARWITCSDTTNSYFPMPVGSLFVQEVFPEENKAATSQMVEDLRSAFKDFLPDNDWMDQPTKDAAEEKADQITPLIAYPDYIVDLNDPKMDNDYAKVTSNQGKYFQTIQDLAEIGATETFNKLGNPVDFYEWGFGPAIVNAYYSPSKNQIVFPAGILQPPFYDAGQPFSMNYGGIGMVIGHEITHGFDDSGAQFDGQGNLNDWWTADSKTNFEDKSKCMEDQYSAQAWDTAGGAHLDGKLTLGENIADNGGIREAYNAYKKWQIANPEGDLRLPGLDDFTQDQLFFLGNAQVWCGVYTPEYAATLLRTDPHSPGMFRVLVPNQNFPEFGDAYGCKKGADAMYPNEEDTCRVW